jgi:hypothetical protein
MLLIPPEKLQLPLKVCSQMDPNLMSHILNSNQIAFVMIVCNIFGMLIWSVSTAHGAGALIDSPATESGSILGWNVVYGIQAVLGLWSGGIVGQSGMTKYLIPRTRLLTTLRLDSLCKDTNCISLRPRGYLSSDNHCHSALWPHHHLRDCSNIWPVLLEPIRASPPHPVRFHDSRNSSRDILLRTLLLSISNGTLHRLKRHFHRHGYGSSMP